MNQETKVIAVSMGKSLELYNFLEEDETQAVFVSKSGNELVVHPKIKKDGTFIKISGGLDIKSADYMLFTNELKKRLKDKELIDEICTTLNQASQRVRNVSSDTSTDSISTASEELKFFLDSIYDLLKI